MKINITDLLKSSNQLEGNCSGVYFLFDREELVYIGKSWNCLLRVAEHTRKDAEKSFTSWNFIAIDVDTEKNNLERKLIQAHNPKYNIIHNR